MEQTQQIEKASGSITGCVLMVSGCCIGAGMVGLPAITAMCGFLPSIVALLIAYLFMVSTGLLFLEVTLLFPKGSHLLSITEKVLGKYGRLAAASLFIFLFFSLIIAYLSGTGELVAVFLSTIFQAFIPQTVGIGLSALFVIFAIYRGAQTVDWVNRIFVTGMAISYLLLITFGMHKVSIDYLSRSVLNRQILLAMPILLVSFGYQNLIPSITTYLNKNKDKIRLSIIIGCSIPFLVYFIWEALILGSLNATQATALSGANSQSLILTILKDSISAARVTLFIQLFSLFALITSLLTVSLSCFDFLSERLTKIRRLPLSCAIIILPPSTNHTFSSQASA